MTIVRMRPGLTTILLFVTLFAVSQSALISYLRLLEPIEYVTKKPSRTWWPNPYDYYKGKNIRTVWMNDWTGFGINPQNVIRIG